MVGWKCRGLCWRVRDEYVPGLHYSLEPLFSSDKNEKNCPPSCRIDHRIGNCFENRVYHPLLDPHLDDHPFLLLLSPLPLPPRLSLLLLLLCCRGHPLSQLLEIRPPSLETHSRTAFRIDRPYCVAARFLLSFCLSSPQPFLSHPPSILFFYFLRSQLASNSCLRRYPCVCKLDSEIHRIKN